MVCFSTAHATFIAGDIFIKSALTYAMHVLFPFLRNNNGIQLMFSITSVAYAFMIVLMKKKLCILFYGLVKHALDPHRKERLT